MTDSRAADSDRAPAHILVIPCYNEGQRLDPAPWLGFLDAFPRFGLLFVDDGSTDNTAPVLEDLRSQRPQQVQVLSLEQNRGKAEAVRAGVLGALTTEPHSVGYWDADLSTPLDAAPAFLAVLDEDDSVELVTGARVQLLGRTVERSALRHYVGRVFAAFASMALGLRVYDTQCGAKLFRVTVGTVGLFELPFLSRWAFDVELLARLGQQRNGAASLEEAVYEFPLQSWIHASGSKVRPLDFPRSMWDLYRIHRRYG